MCCMPGLQITSCTTRNHQFWNSEPFIVIHNFWSHGSAKMNTTIAIVSTTSFIRVDQRKSETRFILLCHLYLSLGDISLS